MPPAKRTAKGAALEKGSSSAIEPRKKKRAEDEQERRLEISDHQTYSRFVQLQIRKCWKRVDEKREETAGTLPKPRNSFWFCEPCRGPEGEILCSGEIWRGNPRLPRRCLGAEELGVAERSIWASRDVQNALLLRDFVSKEFTLRHTKK